MEEDNSTPGDVPGSEEESPGTSQDKRTAPLDTETDKPRKHFRIDSRGTFVCRRQQEARHYSLPDDEQFCYIKDNAANKWKDLARKLGFSTPRIQAFEDEERYLQERCMNMLTDWQQKMGNSGTVGVLKEALEKAGLKNIADNLDFYRGQDSSLVNYNDNQQIAEQERQDNREIQFENMSQAEEPVIWPGIDNMAMALLQRMGVSATPTGQHNLSLPTTSASLDFSFLAWEGTKFHSKLHGKQIKIVKNGTVAQSHDSFKDGICFSSEPIKFGNKTHLKIIVSQVFNESMRFGFTSRDPNSMTVDELPSHSYPTLAQQPGFWVKPLPASLAHHSSVVTFSLEQSGDVTFAVDGEDKGLFFSGVDTSKPLWAVVDIHGSTLAVQFVGVEAASQAFEKIHEGDQVKMWVEDMDTLRDMQDAHNGFKSDMKMAVGQVGIALQIDSDKDVHVFFPSINRRWCMSPLALQKVDKPDIRATTIIEGDLVKITADLEKLKSVLKEKGFWLAALENVPGKIGRAVEVGEHGEILCAVRVAEDVCGAVFDPQVVQKIENQGDMCVQGLHHWKRSFSKVCVKCGECTAECGMKGKPLRPPGSCCGCARTGVVCADCGLCMSCAGMCHHHHHHHHHHCHHHHGCGHQHHHDDHVCDPVELLRALAGLSLEEPNKYGMKRGDEVEVNVDKDTFKRLQQENGLEWNDDMVKVIGVPGIIVAGCPRGNDHATVHFHNDTMVTRISYGCLTKISSETQPLKEGDLVRLMKDEERLKMLQIRHGGYNDKMQDCLGKTGCVKKIQEQHIQVKFVFTSEAWWYNPKALTKVSSMTEEEQSPETVHQLNNGDCVKVAVDPETFSANQLGHGGPVNPVRRALETAGVIHHFDIDGDAYTVFPNGLSCHINPTSLEKVKPEDYQREDSSELRKGEWVKIDDKAKIKQVQTETLKFPWNDGYYAAAGKIGSVESISEKIIHVYIPSANAIFPLHASLVKRASLADMQEHFARSLGSEFARGDLVRIIVSQEELRSLQEGHGGYKPYMKKVMTEAGSVSFLDNEGDIHVRFGLERLCFNPSALTKVMSTADNFYVGDLVHIESDLERFKALQTPAEHGGYVAKMDKLCGKTGRLLSIVNRKKIRVKVQGRAWLFNPDLLRRIGTPGTAAADWKSATICADGKHNWSVGRCMVCVVCGECTEHGKLCHTRGSTGRIPGSVTGCEDGDAGCDDCGVCKSCAGVEDGVELKNDKLEEIIKKTVAETIKKEAEKKGVDEAKTVVTKHRESEVIEVEVGRMELLALLDRMTQVIELMRKSKDFDSDLLVQHIDIPLSQSDHVLQKHFGDHLSNIGAAEVLMEYGSFLSSQASQSDGLEAAHFYGCLKILYGVVNNCAYASSEFSRTLGRSGLLQMTLEELVRHYDMEKSDDNQQWIHLLVTTLGNCARVADNKDYIRDTGAVDLLKKHLLKKHLSEEDMVLKLVTLSCLAHIVDAEELAAIQLQVEDTDFFMNKLEAAVGDAKHAIAFGAARMSAKHFVIDLLALSRHDGNKHAFVEKGVMEPLIQLIESGYNKDKECSMLCVQSFAMVDSIRDTIVSETRVEEVLRALLTKSTPYVVQVAARKTLKCLGKELASSQLTQRI